MHDVKWVAVLALALSVEGCDCGGPTPPSMGSARSTATSAPVVADEDLVVDVTVPRTARTDLPLATPTVEVRVGARGFVVSNRALVASWPAAERERAASAASPTSPDFPIVEASIPSVDAAPLLVPSLRDALSRAGEADRAREAGTGTPIVFSIRAPSDVRWDRVLRALFAAGMAGYAEPWLVVRDAEELERVIRLTSDDHGSPAPSAEALRDTVREALATLGEGSDPLGGTGDDEGEALGAAADPTPPSLDVALPVLSLRLEEHGLRVRRGLVELSADCRTPSSDGSPAFTTAGLDRTSLEACLTAIGSFERASFEASPDVAYGSALTVLETVHARGRPLSIRMLAGDRP
jgi:hypothetical protein